MKIPTDNLFQLIKAMSASEKRYFKRHYSSDKSLTTELFNFINAQEDYDETRVKKHFKKSKLSKNLKVYKVQLTDLLLKSLTSYHNKKTVRSKIRMGLEEVEILMNKQLFELGFSKLLKIKQLCLKYEEFSFIPAILVLEIHFNFFYSANDISQVKLDLLEELEKYTEILKHIFQLKQINLAVTNYHNHRLTQALPEEEKAFYRQFLETQTPRSDNPRLSFNERFFINSITAYIYNILDRDLDREYVYKKKNIELFETHKHFIANHIRLYFAAVFNNVSLSMSLGKEEELEEGIQKVRKLTQQYPSLERNMLFIYFIEAKRNYTHKNYEYFSSSFQEKVLEHIKKYRQEEDYLTVLIFIYFALANLATGKAQSVQFFLRRLRLLAKTLDGNYAQFFNILDLISHYETDDQLIIQNLLSSFRRKQKWRGGRSPFFDDILNFFQEIIKDPPVAKEKLIDDLLRKKEKEDGDGVKNLMKVFILDDWMMAIRKNLKYTDYCQQQQPSQKK